MKQIVVVEDDLAMRQALADLLTNSGYKVALASDFSVDQLLQNNPDLILLDLGLPKHSGLKILQELRQVSDLPIIMVTSSSSETDEALSMGYGADDYITKPYSPNLLLLHISAVLKRTELAGEPTRFRNLKIDLARGLIENVDGGQQNSKKARILLTKNEMIILGHLLGRQNQIVTRDELMTDLWNNQEYINDNALTVNISRLRSKLKVLGADDAIETRKGIGYILS